jgi:hypothetical protein
VNPRALIGVALLVGLGAVFVFLPDAESPGAGGAASAGAGPVDPSPTSCAQCHPAVVDEWRASMHAMAFTDPQVRAPGQSDNFRKTECLPCHAAAPVFAHGIEPGTRVLARGPRRHDGVDCLSCHGLPEGGVAAARSGLDGACRPSFRQPLSSQALCAPCHDQHDTHQEWKASPAAAEGKSCIACHMERVHRVAGEAGAPRSGRSHAFVGGRDRDFALAGLDLRALVSDDRGTLHVELENTFAAHNLPTDSRNRALDLVVTLLDDRGVELPAIPDLGDRHPGGETGSARLRFRNPYRSSGNPSTQLPAGQTATLDVPLGDAARRAIVELYYKLEPWVDDTEAHWSERLELDL